MKHLLLLFLAVAVLSGCSKDDEEVPDPCAGITCLNGGTCANGDCNCLEGYTGSDCSQEETPSSMIIRKVTVYRWPATDDNGAGWDLFDGPDITFNLLTDNSTLHEQNTFYEDANQNQEYSFDVNITLNDHRAKHYINLFDYDDFDSNDFMGGYSFTPYVSGNDFPSMITLDLSEVPVAFRLEVDYNF